MPSSAMVHPHTPDLGFPPTLTGLGSNRGHRVSHWRKVREEERLRLDLERDTLGETETKFRKKR